MICATCGRKMGSPTAHYIGDGQYCDACCPECQPRMIETRRGQRQVRIALVIVCALGLALLAMCSATAIHAAPDALEDYVAMALCRMDTDCFSVIGVYGAPEVLTQVLYWEVFQYPPDEQDWLSLPANGWIETKALGVVIWSPDGTTFEARLLGQLYQVHMPLVF